MFILRFLLGGLIVSIIPEVAKHFGARIAGIVVTVPAISVLALYFTAQAVGVQTAQNVSRSALMGLIPLAAFFITTAYLFKKTTPLASVVAASASWLIVALALVFLLPSVPKY